MYEPEIDVDEHIMQRWEACKSSIERCQVTSRFVLVDGNPWPAL